MQIKEWILYKLILWEWKKPSTIITDWYNAVVEIKGITNPRYCKEIWLKRCKKYLRKNPGSIKVVNENGDVLCK